MDGQTLNKLGTFVRETRGKPLDEENPPVDMLVWFGGGDVPAEHVSDAIPLADLDEMHRLSHAVHYSALLCDPATIKQAVDEIDCGLDCEHTWHEYDTNAGGCYKSERGEFCPFDVAEALRQISAVLYPVKAA